MKHSGIFAGAALLATGTCFALTVNTPVNIAQCLPVLMTWSGGAPPYYLSLIPAGQPSAPAFKTFPATNDNQLTWKADLGSGTSMNVALRDSTGAIAYSDIVTVGSSSDSSCVSTAVSESGAGSTSTSNSTGTSTANGTLKATGSSSALGSASSSSSNGAIHSFSIHVAGIVGLVGVIGAGFL